MDCSPAGSSARGILQAGIPEWVAMPFSIFLTQGLNLGLLHCRQILYHLSHQGREYKTNVMKLKNTKPKTKHLSH